MQPTPLWLTLVSIALSGVVSAVTTVLFNSMNAERVLRRAKLEELCRFLLDIRIALLQRERKLLSGDLEAAKALPEVDVYQMYHAVTLVKLYVPRFYARFSDELVTMRERLVTTKSLHDESSVEEFAKGCSEAGACMERAYLATLEASEPRLSWRKLIGL